MDVSFELFDIIDASSTMKNVFLERFLSRVKLPIPSFIDFWRYIFLWIVKACFPANEASTFAALPVGASNTDLILRRSRVLTTELMMLVLPVPAYPVNKKIVSLLFSQCMMQFSLVLRTDLRLEYFQDFCIGYYILLYLALLIKTTLYGRLDIFFTFVRKHKHSEP